MKKRIVSFLMALVMMTSLLPVQVFAADVDTAVDVPAAVEAQEVQPAEAQQDEEINTPVTQAAESKVTVKYTVNGTEQTATETVIGSYYRKIGTVAEVSGPVFLISLPYGSAVTSVVADSGKAVLYSGAAKARKKTPSAAGYLSNSEMVNPPSKSYYAQDLAGIIFNEGCSLVSTDVTGLMIVADQDLDVGVATIIIVQISTSSGETITDADKAPLKALIDSVADETPQYYEPADGSDKWNGKTYEANGHWNAFVASGILTKAQKVLESPGSKKALDEMCADLTAAIANLIPASQANTTALYEAVQSTPVSNDGAYSTKSWAAYKTVRDKAEALMATMFDAEGNPTDDNKAAANESIEKMAAELKAASKKLDAKGASTSQSIVKLQIEAIQYLAKKYDPDKLSGYTAESMAALRDAWTAALALAADTTVSDIGQNEAQAVTQVLRKLRKAIYGLETDAQGEITVKVSVLDTNDVYRGRGTDSSDRNQHIYTGALTLDANASAYDTLNSRGLLAGSRDFTAGDTLVFLNGEMLYDSGMDMYSDLAYTSGEYSAFQSTKLHNGDELTIVWMYPKQILNSSQVGTYSMALYSNPDWFRYSTVSAPVEVEAGQPFTVSVTSDNALSFHNGSSRRAVAGAGIYRSEAAETADAAATGYVGVNTYAVTDATGKATVTLYNEGYTLLNAFRMDDEGRYTVGASVLVYVKPANDLSAVKKQLRAELDAVYGDENYPESYFTAANWQKVQEAYNAGVAGIDAAETTGDASIAQQTAVQTIKSLQKSADSFNTYNLASFRKSLNELPDDVTKLDQTAATQIAALKKCYDAMSPYQRSQLTGKEQKKYDAIMAANEKGLDEPHNYQLTFKQQFDSSVSAEDQAALKNMIAYLQANTPTDDKYGDITGNKKLPQLFGFQYRRQQIETAQALTYNISACVNPDYVAYLLCRDAAIKAGNRQGPGVIYGKGWEISDATAGVSFVANDNVATMTGGMTYTINGKEYAIRSITVNGTNVPLSGTDNRTWQYKTATLIDASTYKGKTDVHINYKIRNALIDFHMPYGDVTITVTWAPVNADSSEAIAAAKTAAKADLAAELAKYKHSDKNYTNIKTAHDDGVKAIDKASTLAEITKAKASALSEMRMAASGGYYGAAIPNWGAGDGFDAGQQVGTVTVSVANFTYDDGYYYRKAGETPFLYLENYPLGEKDSVMTVILRALKDNGYSWNGSTGKDKNKGEDYGITYLSSVSKTENGKTYTLGEFDGGGQSGWMGTLNDWFTNYGFTEFTVKNRSLGDGDYISIQYTQDGLGADLGGTWDNSDTTLKALEIEGGTLVSKFVPGEAGGTYEYTLAIDSDAAEVRLTPTASNKNFLTKIFLNNKVTDNTEGASFYKRTQYIPVTSGDVIYVGCGERAWPSMNNQEGNTQSNDGTWYALRVVNVKGDAGAVNDMIDALPSASAVKYSSYQQFVDAVAAARTVYDTLDDAAKKAVDPAKLEKLAELEKAIADFQAIDDVKDQLDKLPSAGKLTIDDQEAVKAAQEAYDKLTDEQKEYLSFAQSDKMKDLTTRMDEIIKENPTPTPTPGGNTGNNSSAKNPYQKDNGKDVKSGNTGDAGITLYVGMGLVAVLAGAVIVTRKRKEN